MAGVVGDFYVAMRNGQPVDALVEKMRAMGIISEGSAEGLKGMAEAGEDVTDMTRELSAALSINRGGMASLQNDLAGVDRAFEKAKTTVQEKVGEPFTASEITNTKNFTDALMALAPALGRVAAFYNKLFGLFSTWGSSMAKAIAENEVLLSALEALAKVVGVVVLAISGGAIVWLARLAGSLVAAAAASGILTVALTTLARATLIGLAITAVAMLADKLLKMSGVIGQVEDATNREARAHDEARKAIESRIAAIKTLVEQQEALKAATDEVIKLQNELEALRPGMQKEQGQNATLKTLKEFLGYGTSSETKKFTDKEVELAMARGAVSQISGKTGLVGAAEQQQMEMERRRDFALEEAQLRLREARGEDPLKLGLQQLGVTRKRAGEAANGVSAATEVERKRQADELRIQQLRANGAYGPPLNAAEAAKLDRGLSAPSSSAVFANTMVAKLEHAFEALNQNLSGSERERHAALAGGVAADPQMLAYWRRFAATQKEQEDRLPDLAAAAKEQAADIFEKMQPVASSLARIAGGGNVAEPLTGLAEEQRDLLRQILDELRGGGPAVGVATNEPSLGWGGDSGLQPASLRTGGLRTSHL